MHLISKLNSHSLVFQAKVDINPYYMALFNNSCTWVNFRRQHRRLILRNGSKWCYLVSQCSTTQPLLVHAKVPASSATTKVNRKINTFGINILTIVWNNLFEQLWNNIHSSYITDTSYSSIFSASEFKSYQSAVLCIHKARLFRPNKSKDKWI